MWIGPLMPPSTWRALSPHRKTVFGSNFGGLKVIQTCLTELMKCWRYGDVKTHSHDLEDWRSICDRHSERDFLLCVIYYWKLCVGRHNLPFFCVSNPFYNNLFLHSLIILKPRRTTDICPFPTFNTDGAHMNVLAVLGSHKITYRTFNLSFWTVCQLSTTLSKYLSQPNGLLVETKTTFIQMLSLSKPIWAFSDGADDTVGT